MKKSMVLLLLLSLMVLSCESGPKLPEVSLEPEQVVLHEVEEISNYIPDEAGQLEGPAEISVEIPVKISAEVPEPEKKTFDPNNVSVAMYQAAKLEITYVIYELNWIIKSRDYELWVDHLTDSYYEEISARDFLDGITEELYRRDQIVAQNLGRDPNQVEKRILRTARDYFDYVVVPSRANDKMDDISFLSEDRVRVYTMDERRGQRLVLYDLASINHKWLIAN